MAFFPEDVVVRLATHYDRTNWQELYSEYRKTQICDRTKRDRKGNKKLVARRSFQYFLNIES